MFQLKYTVDIVNIKNIVASFSHGITWYHNRFYIVSHGITASLHGITWYHMVSHGYHMVFSFQSTLFQNEAKPNNLRVVKPNNPRVVN